MSIATELSRIQTDRNTIRDKLIELGLAESTSNLSVLAAAIEDIVNQGAVQVEIVEGTSYTIPAGYHNGSGTVKALTDTAGESEKYKLQAKAVTPTKNQQSVTPDTGYYALSAVTVNAIPAAYQNVSSVTAEASNVLTGKVFVTADGKVTTGTMTNNGAVSKTLDGTTVSYTIPAGYHSGSGKVTIVLEEKSITPTKSIQTVTPTSGKVLSKVTVNPIPDNYYDTSDADYGSIYVLKDKVYYGSKGKVTGTMKDNGKVTLSLDASTSYVDLDGYYGGGSKVQTTLSSKTVTPTKETQVVKPQTGCLYKQVTVNPIPDNYIDTTDADAVATDILDGKFAYVDGVKVEGTMPKQNVQVGLDLKTTKYYIPKGYHSGTGTVEITPVGMPAIPTKSTQTIKPGDGQVLSFVEVYPIPDEYQDVTAVTAVSTDVLAGKKIVSSNGTVVTGTMKNNGSTSKSLDGLTTTSVTIPAGYTTGGTVSLTGDIESALAAI